MTSNGVAVRSHIRPERAIRLSQREADEAPGNGAALQPPNRPERTAQVVNAPVSPFQGEEMGRGTSAFPRDFVPG